MLAALANARGLAAGIAVLRPQDVFATSLYTGGANPLTVTNGIDLAGKGGLVWIKTRNVADDHFLYDTSRGVRKFLQSNTTVAEASSGVTSFNSNGFTLEGFGPVNNAGSNHASWSFRRASKFFDIVTYTGDGTSGRVIPHALGIKPGMIIVKRRSGTGNWPVYHSSLGATQQLYLVNTTAASANVMLASEPTSTDFTLLNGGGDINTSGSTYVAYLFAHDPDTTNGIVQCGSFTTDANGAASVPLGWRPQWLLAKNATSAGSWVLVDTARGWSSGADAQLFADSSNAEDATSQDRGAPSATGFTYASGTANSNYVYLAIRAPI